jgi:tRNA G18 (ribose-2'-O)-methylase SpoU
VQWQASLLFPFDLETLIDTVVENGKNAIIPCTRSISDARNFGAIIRTAECTGVNGIIVQSGFSTSKRRYRKTSAGAVFNIPICKVEHIKDAIFLLQVELKLCDRNPFYDLSNNGIRRPWCKPFCFEDC